MKARSRTLIHGWNFATSSFANGHMLNKTYVYRSNCFGITTNQKNSKHLTFKLKVKDISYFTKVQQPDVSCQLANAYQKYDFGYFSQIGEIAKYV